MTDPRNIMNDQFLVTPLTLREREQMKECMTSFAQTFKLRGVDAPIAILTLINLLAHTLANEVDDKQERRTRTEWVQTQLPLYVAAFEQREKKIDD